MRLFVSIDLEGLAEAVAAVQEPLEGRSGLNLTDPEEVHVTLKFLGDTAESRVDELTRELAAAVEAADVDPFTVEFGGLGVFPSLSYISVVWLDVRAGGEEMTRLHEAIEDYTVAMGFDPEEHDFTPHATLARMEHAGPKDFVQEYVTGDTPEVGRMRVEDVRLKESTLFPDGPQYTTVEQFPL